MRNTMKSLAILAVLGLLAGSCASMSEVEERGADIQKLIDQKKAACYVCAPVELAQAEAHLEFARYQSSIGNGILANHHLEKALVAVRSAWEKSNDKRCAPDADNDGIPDTLDGCPDRPEDFDGDRDEDGCPDLDQDGDGIDDDKDVCPTVPEDRDGYQDEDGCPDADNDSDGLADGTDKCPNEPEDRDGYMDEDGCPDPDNDGDGIADLQDKCPNEPEDMDGDADEDGCPDLYQNIVITAKKIELKEKIFFATNSDVILKQSFGLMDEIYDALAKHPDLRVRIEGHTDNKGAYNYNKKLSQRRADSVKRYLTRKGIANDRLLSVGFGPDMPIDDNGSEQGRSNNRRVEFNIIE
jgi:outer membrane protein OmpA-like peptidoglycan-associated protein